MYLNSSFDISLPCLILLFSVLSWVLLELLNLKLNNLVRLFSSCSTPLCLSSTGPGSLTCHLHVLITKFRGIPPSLLDASKRLERQPYGISDSLRVHKSVRKELICKGFTIDITTLCSETESYNQENREIPRY
jgi:hypothetical protein